MMLFKTSKNKLKKSLMVIFFYVYHVPLLKLRQINLFYTTFYLKTINNKINRIHERALRTLKAFDDFKNKQKSVWINVFWYVKVCIFWKGIQHTIHWEKTQMLKNFPSDKMNGTKNVLFLLSRAPTHHGFTFNLQFLYELRHNVCPSNGVWDFYISIPLCFY